MVPILQYDNKRTDIGGLSVHIRGKVFSKEFENIVEITEQITALLWGLA